MADIAASVLARLKNKARAAIKDNEFTEKWFAAENQWKKGFEINT